jgi:hypothetical protein
MPGRLRHLSISPDGNLKKIAINIQDSGLSAFFNYFADTVLYSEALYNV